MESFIVRIYRQDELDPSQITGTVVKAGEDLEASFSTSDELLNIISHAPDGVDVGAMMIDPEQTS